MSTSYIRKLDDYPELKECASDLRSCSKDNAKAGDVTYMFDGEDTFAIDFDNVMRAFCKEGEASGSRRQSWCNSPIVTRSSWPDPSTGY